MEFTLQKTFTFILFILIGLLLKKKFKGGDEVSGIKKIILNLALPATIFIALLSIEIEASLLLLPVLALLLNGILFLGFPLLLPVMGVQKDTPNYRTAQLLIPSLAPGLSCFPFVLEFLGEPYLAKAAMADLGNKVFVLIGLYIIAMNWHSRLQVKEKTSRGNRIKSLLIAMISEPVNIFIAVALLLLSLGWNMESIPFVISDTLDRLSLLMTPLVLLFIGLAVKIKRNQLSQILSILLVRAGVVVLISAFFIAVAGITAQNNILLILAFGLSAVSFWPFAHISAVESLESKVPLKQRTFNNNYGISILALSFPLSTILILGILSSGTVVNGILPVVILGTSLLALGFLPVILSILKKAKLSTETIPAKKEFSKVEIKERKYQAAVSESS